MKKPILLFVILLSVFILSSSSAFCTIRTITVQSFNFSPLNTIANVGDTIKWQWLDGRHTTTCNNTNGTSLPAGAAPWDAPMEGTTPVFMYKVTVLGNYAYNCTFHAPSMAGTISVTTAITNLSDIVPDKFNLSQNYPNPFNPVTKINFQIASSGNVKLNVYDISGKSISDLVDQHMTPGSYSVTFDASSVPSGVYFYRLETDLYSEVKRMMLIK